MTCLCEMAHGHLWDEQCGALRLIPCLAFVSVACVASLISSGEPRWQASTDTASGMKSSAGRRGSFPHDIHDRGKIRQRVCPFSSTIAASLGGCSGRCVSRRQDSSKGGQERCDTVLRLQRAGSRTDNSRRKYLAEGVRACLCQWCWVLPSLGQLNFVDSGGNASYANRAGVYCGLASRFFAWDSHPPLDGERRVMPDVHPWARLPHAGVQAHAEASEGDCLWSVGRDVPTMFAGAAVHGACINADLDIIRCCCCLPLFHQELRVSTLWRMGFLSEHHSKCPRIQKCKKQCLRLHESVHSEHMLGRRRSSIS